MTRQVTRPRKQLRIAARAILAMLLAGTLAGCGVLSGSLYDAPLPGGADLGDHPISLSADFADVLDLVPQSSVKVDHVTVGTITGISLNPDGHSARVTMLVNNNVELPAGTVAHLKQTSLLGEKYVALVRPANPAAGGSLQSGDHIGLAQTSRAAEVEQVLGALSLVLNGGGLAQFQEISRELREVSTGRPGEIKGFLEELKTFVTRLDSRKEAITDAIDQLAKLSETVRQDNDKIAAALEGLSPGMQVIVDQREQLVKMLEALDRLSEVTVDTLDAAQEDIVADLKALQPILDKLAEAGADLPNSLEILLTYPFPDSVLGAIKGDYLNVFITTNFRTLPADCAAMGCPWPQPPLPDMDLPGSGSTASQPESLSEMYSKVEPADPSETPKDGESSGDAGSNPSAPQLLPPTSSSIPGLPSSTVTVPAPPTGSSESPPPGEPTAPSSPEESSGPKSRSGPSANSADTGSTNEDGDG